VSVRVHV